MRASLRRGCGALMLAQSLCRALRRAQKGLRPRGSRWRRGRAAEGDLRHPSRPQQVYRPGLRAFASFTRGYRTQRLLYNLNGKTKDALSQIREAEDGLAVRNILNGLTSIASTPTRAVYAKSLVQLRKLQEPDEILSLAESIDEKSVPLDRGMYHDFIEAMVAAGAWEQAIEAVEQLQYDGIIPDGRTLTLRLLMCTMPEAKDMFPRLALELERKSTFDINIVESLSDVRIWDVAKSYAEAGLVDQMIQFLEIWKRNCNVERAGHLLHIPTHTAIYSVSGALMRQYYDSLQQSETKDSDFEANEIFRRRMNLILHLLGFPKEYYKGKAVQYAKVILGAAADLCDIVLVRRVSGILNNVLVRRVSGIVNNKNRKREHKEYLNLIGARMLVTKKGCDWRMLLAEVKFCITDRQARRYYAAHPSSLSKLAALCFYPASARGNFELVATELVSVLHGTVVPGDPAAPRWVERVGWQTMGILFKAKDGAFAAVHLSQAINRLHAKHNAFEDMLHSQKKPHALRVAAAFGVAAPLADSGESVLSKAVEEYNNQTMSSSSQIPGKAEQCLLALLGVVERVSEEKGDFKRYGTANFLATYIQLKSEAPIVPWHRILSLASKESIVTSSLVLVVYQKYNERPPPVDLLAMALKSAHSRIKKKDGPLTERETQMLLDLLQIVYATIAHDVSYRARDELPGLVQDICQIGLSVPKCAARAIESAWKVYVKWVTEHIGSEAPDEMVIGLLDLLAAVPGGWDRKRLKLVDLHVNSKRSAPSPRIITRLMKLRGNTEPDKLALYLKRNVARMSLETLAELSKLLLQWGSFQGRDAAFDHIYSRAHTLQEITTGNFHIRVEIAADKRTEENMASYMTSLLMAFAQVGRYDDVVALVDAAHIHTASAWRALVQMRYICRTLASSKDEHLSTDVSLLDSLISKAVKLQPMGMKPDTSLPEAGIEGQVGAGGLADKGDLDRLQRMNTQITKTHNESTLSERWDDVWDDFIACLLLCVCRSWDATPMFALSACKRLLALHPTISETSDGTQAIFDTCFNLGYLAILHRDIVPLIQSKLFLSAETRQAFLTKCTDYRRAQGQLPSSEEEALVRLEALAQESS